MSSHQHRSITAGRMCALAAAIALTAGGCTSSLAPTGVVSATGTRTVITAGQEVQLRVGTLGGGSVALPPRVSSWSAQYVRAEDSGDASPGGPTLLVTFYGAMPGTTVITFANSNPALTVVDTIEVR